MQQKGNVMIHVRKPPGTVECKTLLKNPVKLVFIYFSQK